MAAASAGAGVDDVAATRQLYATLGVTIPAYTVTRAVDIPAAYTLYYITLRPVTDEMWQMFASYAVGRLADGVQRTAALAALDAGRLVAMEPAAYGTRIVALVSLEAARALVKDHELANEMANARTAKRRGGHPDPWHLHELFKRSFGFTIDMHIFPRVTPVLPPCHPLCTQCCKCCGAENHAS